MGNLLLNINVLTLLGFNLINYFLVGLGFGFSVQLQAFVLLTSLGFVLVENKLKGIKEWNYVFLLLFVGLVLFSVIFFPNTTSLFKFQVFLVRTILVVCVIDLLICSGYRINFNFILLIGLLTAIILLYNASKTGFLLRTSLIVEESEISRTPLGAIEDSRNLVFILMILLIIGVKSPFTIWVLPIIVGGLLVTQTRQSVFGFILILVPYAMFWGRKNITLMRYLKFGGVLVLLFVIALVASGVDISIDRLTETQETLRNLSDGNRLDRGYLFRWAYDIFQQNPLVGSGFGYTDDTFTYPHNILLELLAETGVLGFLLFVVFVLYRFISCDDNGLRAFIALTFLFAQISGNITSNYLLFFSLMMDRRYLDFTKKIISHPFKYNIK